MGRICQSTMLTIRPFAVRLTGRALSSRTAWGTTRCISTTQLAASTDCDISSYRDGLCNGCASCPSCWSAVELHSEHYRCAESGDLDTSTELIDLGTIAPGGTLDVPPQALTGFLQSPTLPRLPPGVVFSDDGALSGLVLYDPLRPAEYQVDFIAFSTVQWKT